jgi:hypothetical protein
VENARSDIIENDEKFNIFLKNSVQINGLYAAKVNDRQEDTGEDMEANG